MSEETSEHLQELGNAAVRNQNFAEAILHYTHAIKLDSTNHILYSNRSYAFLKLQQLYFALEDAKETIKLEPVWAKGYFRKGEVEFAAGHYAEACISYKDALKLLPEDVTLIESLKKAIKALQKDKEDNEKIPWLGAGLGLIIGVTIAVAEYVFADRPSHPILMSFITILVAMVGYGIARTYRYYVRCQTEGLLEPPPSLCEDEQSEDKESSASKSHTRYTKSQARHRYKLGKT